jgi:hypothetical protein
MSEKIIEGTLFNTNQVIFGTPKVSSAQGGKSIGILNKGTKTGLVLATPLMLTWGGKDFKEPGAEIGNDKFDMALQFPSAEYQTADSTAFLNNMKAFESHLKDSAFTNAKDWFGKSLKSPDVVEALFNPMLKYSKDKATGDYDLTKAPTLKVKIPKWEGAWKSEIYDEDGCKLFPSATNTNVTPVDYLKKGSMVMCLIQCVGIWIVNGNFGVGWKLVQAVVQKPKPTLSGQCFLKLKTVDKEKLQSQRVPDEEVVSEDHVASSIVDDSDEEEEEEEEEMMPPAPPPTPVPVVAQKAEEDEEKKIVVKKIIKKKA